MAERQGINLLPEEGRAEEALRVRRRLLNFGGLGVLGLILLLSVGTFVYGAYLRNSDNGYLNQISSATQTLQGLSQTELLYRSVVSKISRLQTLLATYPRNSLILDDMASFTPAGVSLTNLTYDDTSKVSLTGVASGPGPFGTFVAILQDPKLGGSKFTGVQIVSVAGGGSQGDYRFALSMNLKAGNP